MSPRRHLHVVADRPATQGAAAPGETPKRPVQLVFGMPDADPLAPRTQAELDRIAERLRSSGRGVG